jgi:hypothetical protein
MHLHCRRVCLRVNRRYTEKSAGQQQNAWAHCSTTPLMKLNLHIEKN